MRTRTENQFSTFFDRNYVFFYGVLFLLILNAILLMTNNQGEVLYAINKLRRSWSDAYFIYGTKLGEPIAYVIVITLLAAFNYRHAIFALVTGAAAGIISGLFKVWFAQPRPMRWIFDNQEEIWHSLNLFEEDMRNWSDVSSFPSGHATSAFALYSFVCFNLSRPKLLISVGCFLLAVTVGFSRMYLLFHFLRDVTVGAALGVIIGTAVYFLQYKIFPNLKVLDRGYLRGPKSTY